MKGNKVSSKNNKKIRVIAFFLMSLIFVAVAVSVAVVGLSYLENQNFKETFYSVSSLKVNNKIRIIQISDLHDCTYGEGNAKLIDRIDKLDPDIIILTGDCHDVDSESTEVIVSLCASLAEIAPSYYIFGNNEIEKYYSFSFNQYSIDSHFKFDDDNREPGKLLEYVDPLTKELSEVGVVVLKNSTATITVGDTTVDVYGVLTSNPSAFWSYSGDSFDDYIYTNENHLKITAIHEPTVFEEFTPDSWGDLMLAGHTHGGLVNIPMIGALYTQEWGLLPERSGHYVDGRYEVSSRPLIISSGLENKSFVRINNQPEIVIVDINKF